jgi:hypothetical protein
MVGYVVLDNARHLAVGRSVGKIVRERSETFFDNSRQMGELTFNRCRSLCHIASKVGGMVPRSIVLLGGLLHGASPLMRGC